MEDFIKVVVVGLVMLGIPMALVLSGPLGRALAARIEGRGASDADLRALRGALAEAEERLEDTDRRLAETTQRLAEVEERLDFAERLLTRERAAPQLPGGTD
jgi:uncharacterized membrane protein YccC